MCRVVMLAALVLGCASVPDPENTNVVVTDFEVSEDATEIYGPGFSMSFAKSGVRLPTSLIHTVEVFGESTCPTPSRAGASIAPFQTAVGERMVAGLDATRNTIEATLRGPAVVQIVVAYDVPYMCAGPQSLRGTSTFTLVPSGRIVRNDTVQPSTGAMITDAVACQQTCDGTQRDATLDVFWAFAPGGDRLLGDDKAIAPGTVIDAAFSCAAYDTHTVAIAWNGAVAKTSASSSGPLTYAHELFGRVLAVPQAMQMSSSTILVAPGRETCARMAQRTRLPRMLVLDDGSPQDLLLDASEIYTDLTARSGRIEIRPVGDEAVNDGFALRLVIGTPDHLAVSRRSGQRAEIALQREGDQTIIWIAGGIPSGDAIIIEAR